MQLFVFYFWSQLSCLTRCYHTYLHFIISQYPSFSMLVYYWRHLQPLLLKCFKEVQFLFVEIWIASILLPFPQWSKLNLIINSFFSVVQLLLLFSSTLYIIAHLNITLQQSCSNPLSNLPSHYPFKHSSLPLLPL